jgi:hypothetical protein
VKIKALKNWPPQEWRSEAQTLAPENALDAADVSASVEVNQPGVLILSVTHKDHSLRRFTFPSGATCD